MSFTGPSFMHTMQSGVVIRDGKPFARDTFTEPNLAEMVTKYQAILAPEDPKFGEGISGWDITSEYDPDPSSESDGAPIWGCMCSPSVLASEGKRVKLQPEDIAEERAHIVVRTPKNRDDLLEVERTVIHELGHVLHAKLDLPRDAEEEIMHALDNFFANYGKVKSSADQYVDFANSRAVAECTTIAKGLLIEEAGKILYQSLQNPMARAYRAKDKAMPDSIEEKKDPDKETKEAPKMAEGAPRDIGTIEAELLKTRLAGGDIGALLDEWLAAKMAATAAGAPAAAAMAAAPEVPPGMGMKTEEAYARAKHEEGKKAVKTLVDNLPGLDAKQKKYLHGRVSIEEVNEALEAMPRVQTPVGLPEHPAKGKGAPVARNVGGLAGADASAMARSMGAKRSTVMMPKILPNGRFSLGDATPTQLREAIARGDDPRKNFPSTIGEN